MKDQSVLFKAYKLISDNSSKGRFFGRKELAELMGVSERTLNRYIKQLKDDHDCIVENDKVRNAYYVNESTSHMDMESFSVYFTDSHMLALSIAQSAFANYKGEKQKESLKYLKKALHECMCLDPDVEKKADRKISFRAYGDSTIDPDIFEVVSNALIYEKMLSINYQTLTKKSHGKNADTVPSITVTPLHMSCIDNQWYLFALPEKEKQVRVYSMVRISGVRVGDSCDDYPENFSVDDFLEKRFKIAHGDGKKEYDIKILFDQEVADFVMGKKWHPNEKMSLKEDGKVLYEITLSSLVEIESWLLSFRYHFQVLEPKELRTKVRKTAKRLLDNHM